jgi:hypothetical protein
MGFKRGRGSEFYASITLATQSTRRVEEPILCVVCFHTHGIEYGRAPMAWAKLSGPDHQKLA